MKKSFFLLFVVFFININHSPAQNWRWQNPLPQGSALRSIVFPDANTGYAVGNDGAIIKTTDGGASWIPLSTGTYTYYYSVFFTSVTRGFAVGSGGTIISTIDGGEHWSTCVSGTTIVLFSVFFTNLNTGYAVGASGTVLKTTNGGNDWIMQTSGTSNALFSVFLLIRIQVILLEMGQS